MEPTKQSLDELKRNFWADLKKLLRPSNDPEKPIKRWLLIGGTLCLLIMFGALSGFAFAYKKLNLFADEKEPTLHG